MPKASVTTKNTVSKNHQKNINTTLQQRDGKVKKIIILMSKPTMSNFMKAHKFFQ